MSEFNIPTEKIKRVNMRRRFAILAAVLLVACITAGVSVVMRQGSVPVSSVGGALVATEADSLCTDKNSQVLYVQPFQGSTELVTVTSVSYEQYRDTATVRWERLHPAITTVTALTVLLGGIAVVAGIVVGLVYLIKWSKREEI